MDDCCVTHIAIIADGNGRWALKNGMSRTDGHKYGEKKFIEICKLAESIGLKYLTVYGFSTENWERASNEVESLMCLFLKYVNFYISIVDKCNYKFRVIGSRDGLNTELLKAIEHLERITSDKSGLCIQVAYNYGGRDEILRAIKTAKSSWDVSDTHCERDFSDLLDTKGIPDPDIIIRTGGEKRLSNFLLWQCAYSELFFVDEYWPDFSKEKFLEILNSFKNRNRRFGAVNE